MTLDCVPRRIRDVHDDPGVYIRIINSKYVLLRTLCAGRTQCWIDMSPWQWKLYISIVATTVFVVPAIVISGCYAIIVYTIWSKSKLLSPAKSNTQQRGTKSNIISVRISANKSMLWVINTARMKISASKISY